MQVTIRQFVRSLQQALNEAGVQRSVQLGKGQCKDFEEYKKTTGFIAGLDAAGSLADQMLRQLEEKDRDDDLPPMAEGQGQ